MDGADPDRWSAVAAGWAELWGGMAEPVWETIVDLSGIASGMSALDVGCGTGDFLAHLDPCGVSTAGIDPAPEMVEFARARVPRADVRLGEADELPWPDATFDLVTSINALQFASDTAQALAELARVTRPGGHIAVANWAEADRNDLDTIEEAVARAAGEEPLPGGDLRQPGGLEDVLAESSLDVVAAGVVEVAWAVDDDRGLVRGILLGESPESVRARTPIVVAAARPFRQSSGGYRLTNAFRYAIARVPAMPSSQGR